MSNDKQAEHNKKTKNADFKGGDQKKPRNDDPKKVDKKPAEGQKAATPHKK